MSRYINSIRKQSHDKNFFIGCLLWMVIFSGVQIGVLYLVIQHSETSNNFRDDLWLIAYLQLAAVFPIIPLRQRLKSGKVLIESKPFSYQTWLTLALETLISLAVVYTGFGWSLSGIAWVLIFMLYLATMAIGLLFTGNNGSQICQNGIWFKNKESISFYKLIPWHKIESYGWTIDPDKYIGMEIQYQLKLKLKNGKQSNNNATVELDIPMDKKEMAETLLFEHGIRPS